MLSVRGATLGKRTELSMPEKRTFQKYQNSGEKLKNCKSHLVTQSLMVFSTKQSGRHEKVPASTCSTRDQIRHVIKTKFQPAPLGWNFSPGWNSHCNRPLSLRHVRGDFRVIHFRNCKWQPHTHTQNDRNRWQCKFNLVPLLTTGKVTSFTTSFFVWSYCK